MPNVVDLSHLLDANLVIYPGDPKFSSCPHLMLSSDGVNVQCITLGSHAGTHIDAPFHFIEDGKKVDEIPISVFVGRAIVADLTEQGLGRQLRDREEIQWKDLERYEDAMRTQPDAMLLLRTGWSQYWGTQKYFDHPYVSAEAARQIVEIGVRLVGTDTLSPDETVLEGSAGTEHSYFFHKIVLGAGLVIAENLTNLEAIQEGEWVVSLVPLKLGGSDGSPVRACAWRSGQF
jgi:kynurenine formamidase